MWNRKDVECRRPLLLDGLSIMSLTNLRKLQEELVETSASASALLAWLLQLKDAQTQDSTT